MRIVPRAEVERRWRAWEKKTLRRRLDETTPETVNAETAADLLDRREIVFRGRRYAAPPVPWPLAAKLLAAKDDLAALGEGDDVYSVEAVFLRVTRLAKKALRPTSPLQRFLWPITPNPFRRATPKEVGSLVGFFFGSVMLDLASSRTPREATASAGPRGTSRATSRASWPGSPPGSAATATPSPGGIS